MTILVTGAAGKTGRAIIRSVVAAGGQVRALVYKETYSAVVSQLGAQENIVGDMREWEVLSRATEGIKTVYHICPNVHPEEVAIAQKVIDASARAGVEHFVYHSVIHPQTEKMPHHWQKLRVEELVFESLLPFTIVQPSVYMQNILANWRSIVKEGIYPVPYGSHATLNMVDLEDVAQAVAKILLETRHLGAIYELAGPENLVQSQVASILTEVVQRPVKSRRIPLEKWTKQARLSGVDPYQVDTLIKMFKYYDEYGLHGNSNVLAGLLNRPPTTLFQFARRQVETD